MAASLEDVSRRDKLGLIAEWMDPHASLLRRFYFFFYPYDSTIEMYDVKRNRIFLRRTRVENLNFGDIYVGNYITIFSRQVKLVDYANLMTKRLLGMKMMKTFALITPDGIENMSKILQILLSNGFIIINLRMLKFTDNIAENLLEDEKNCPTYLELKTHLQSGASIAMELVGENAVDRLKKIAGPKDPKVARNEEPSSIIALMGFDEVHNSFYYSPSVSVAAKQTQLTFANEQTLKNPETQTVLLQDSTCCVVKPHAVKEGKLGDILSEIEKKGFKITAMQMFHMNAANTEEFYEIYKGVLAEYTDMVQELTSGTCVAMEITGPYGKDTPLHFRAFVGPSDPDIARKLRPDTLRAHFGKDKVHNAVHASDLPTDGILEVEYFFKVIV
uniref:Putative nucleoside diphosphate kinase-containing protein n=1 Tax=Panstrongylus lignarius TaxID=156445 RepID=A0A224XRR5_9HEMI